MADTTWLDKLLGNGAAGVTPLGSGFARIIAGVLQTDASSVDLAANGPSGDVTGILKPGNGGTGITAPGTIGNVLTSDGAGGWVSLPNGEDAEVTQLTWQISNVGPNTNTGAPGSPITLAEFERRVGSGRWSGVGTVSFLNSPATPLPRFANFQGEFDIRYEGIVTVVRAGVIAGLTRLVKTANPVEPVIDDTSATADANGKRRLRLTSGTESGKMAWFGSDLGGNRITIGAPAASDVNGGYTLANFANINDGDTFNVEELNIVIPASLVYGTVTVHNVRIESLGATGPTYAYAVESIVDTPYTNNGSNCYVYNCRIEGYVNVGGYLGMVGGVSTGICRSDGAGTVTSLEGDFIAMTNVIQMGGVIDYGSFGVFRTVGTTAIAVQYAARIFGGDGGFGEACFGAGNSGSGIQMVKFCNWHCTTIPTIKGGSAANYILLAGNNAARAALADGTFSIETINITPANLALSVAAGGFGGGAQAPEENIQFLVVENLTPGMGPTPQYVLKGFDGGNASGSSSVEMLHGPNQDGTLILENDKTYFITAHVNFALHQTGPTLYTAAAQVVRAIVHQTAGVVTIDSQQADGVFGDVAKFVSCNFSVRSGPARLSLNLNRGSHETDISACNAVAKVDVVVAVQP